MFCEHQISILEWFLKDYVTLKTGGMMLKFILIYIKTENYFIHFKL